MGKAEEVWPLLKHSADPRFRSFIVNWLESPGGRPEVRRRGTRRIDAEGQAGARRGPAEDGCRPVPPRDLDAAGLDPGARGLMARRASLPANEGR